MSDNKITLTINGQKVQASPGSMLIEVADEHGIHIPRFCYHKKLSVSANCRMCLVEIEKSPKPMPACATPVAEGMNVLTHSVKAVSAQKATMEFLLINHPLDCPICDQGGECELQDVSVSHGEHSSQYFEMKRVIPDKDIGPLIETEMTRCIQCTRCVRFGDEIAGMRELGATGRGERMEIGTYIEKSLESELSGNVIDVCPVGALTAKPSRYKARAWEITQHPSVAPHDSVGSNIYLHTFQNQVMRVVPKENEEINECWLSDRDRFSYEGLNAEDRQLQPMVKKEGHWRTVEWDKALELVGEHLNTVNPDEVGVLVSDKATTEELYLLQKLMRSKGINNIDHRLRQTDYSDQGLEPQFPWLGMSLGDLEKLDAVVLIGSDVRREQPLANHRIRKAVQAGAKVVVINPLHFGFNYAVEHELVRSPAGMLNALLSLVGESGDFPASFPAFDQEQGDHIAKIVELLKDADNTAIFLGNLAVQHPAYATLRAGAAALAQHCKAKLGYLAESTNTAGAWLTGNLPHRSAGGQSLPETGKHMGDMLMSSLKTYVLLGVEPEYDSADPQMLEGVLSHAKVIAFTAFASDRLRACADILLPIATFAETSGTFINAEGRQQSFRAAAKTPGDVKQCWKVLRVLGNIMDVDGFDYMSSTEVLDEFNRHLTLSKDNQYAFDQLDQLKPVGTVNGLQRISSVHAYSSDMIVRRATALQKMYSDERNALYMNPADIIKLEFTHTDSVTVSQGDGRVIMSLVEDEGVPEGCVYMLAATNKSSVLGPSFGSISIQGGS